MEAEFSWGDFLEALSRRKKGTSVILKHLEAELSWYAAEFYRNWAAKYKSETDVCVALGRWEEEAEIILAGVSGEVQLLLWDFAKWRQDHALEMKQEKNSSNNRDSL